MGRDAKPADVVTREYTINLGKAITGITFKKRAPRAVAAVSERCDAMRANGQALVAIARERANARANVANGSGEMMEDEITLSNSTLSTMNGGVDDAKGERRQAKDDRWTNLAARE